MLHMLQRISGHFETFTKLVDSFTGDPERPEDPFAPDNPETWPIEEQQRREGRN